MGPKKKGKGSKLAKMTDEERARYLQHRAAIEEEARRRKEQLISTFMKNKLKKEDAFSRLNAAKINQQWRQTLRVLKCSELKQELDALHKWFEHTANKKTQLIECLLGNLQEAENQYSRIHQCHMETVDHLLGIYNGRINILQSSFEKERDRMFLKARSDVEEMVHTSVSREEHLHAIIFRMQQTSKEATDKAAVTHNSYIDELRNQMLTELESLVNRREARMETLWTSFQAVLQKYWSQTEDRRREYLNLRDTDSDNCSHIFHYHQQINALNEMLQGLKNQLSSDNSSINDRVVERQTDKEASMELFHVLRQKLNIEQNSDRKKLCYMTAVAQNITKDLDSNFGKGTQILQLLNLCKKLETTNETICPGGLSPPVLTKETERSIQEETMKIGEPLAEEALKKFSKLDKFWKRYNQVLIEKEALSLHCQELVDEQRKLKYVLKQYFSEFSSSQALPKAPLLIHRPATTGARKQISLKGNKVIPRAGKLDIYSDQHPPFMHMLTIELTKSV